MIEHILSILIFFPLVAGVLGFMVNKESMRAYGIAVSGIEFALSLWLWYAFDGSNGGFQFTEMIALVPAFGINYQLGIDGISLFIVIMSTLITFIGIASLTETRNVKNMIITLLVLEMTMIGVFVTLDAIVFYLFWELSLVPMLYLIGAWGGPKAYLCVYQVLLVYLYRFIGDASGYDLYGVPIPAGYRRSGRSLLQSGTESFFLWTTSYGCLRRSSLVSRSRSRCSRSIPGCHMRTVRHLLSVLLSLLQYSLRWVPTVLYVFHFRFSRMRRYFSSHWWLSCH